MGPFMIRIACVSAPCSDSRPRRGPIDASPTLGRVVKESTNIVVLRVEKVSKEKGGIIYSKVEDLKGKYPAGEFKHQLTGGWHPGEAKLVLDWASRAGSPCASSTASRPWSCIDNYWYGATAAEPPWWVMTSGEARLGYAYAGRRTELRGHLTAMFAGKEVVIPVVQFHADRQKVYRQRDIADFKNVFRGRDCPICRIKASLKMSDSPDGSQARGAGPAGPEDVPALLKALEQKDGQGPGGRRRAAGPGRPARQGRTSGPPPRRRRTQNGLVRVKAADAVARIDPKDQAAVPVLIEALKDKSGKARRAAAEVLGDIGAGAAAAVPALVAALKDADEDVRWAAAEALRDVVRRRRPPSSR